MNHRKALALLVITAILWSTGGILIKTIQLHPLAIAGSRSVVAAIVLALATRQFKFTWSKAQIVTAISFAATVLLFVLATKLTTAANAILLQYTAPIYAAILSGPLLGEKVQKRDWITLAAVIGGMVLFFLDEVSTEHTLGNVVALASGLAFAGIALGLRMQKGVSTFESILLGHICCAIVGLPFLAAGPWPTVTDQLYILLLGVVQLGIPYVLYGIAIKHVTAVEATLVPVIEPILNPIWVAFFIGEKPSGYAMAGGGVVVAAVLMHALSSARARAH